MRTLQFLRTVFLVVVAIPFFSGCGDLKLGDPNNKDETRVIRSAGDEVKLIDANIRNSKDPVSLRATSYPLSNSSRLLLRVSSLKSSSWDILEQQPILLKIDSADVAMAAKIRAGLKICPLQKNWMMLATWSKAHPYKDGNWSRAGGDFDPGDCISALPANHASIATGEESDFCSGTTRVCFDLMPWFQFYVRERHTDFGLMLTADNHTQTEPLIVKGDATAQGPSIFWRRLR